MIKAKDAIATARSLIGTPYTQMDCIGLVRAVIQRSPGGDPGYRCEGTNWLWDSINNSGKYKHLIARQEGLTGVQAGMLPFKRYGTDQEDHVGIATGEGTVIHSSSVKGCVVETPLTAAEGWDLLGTHRYIETAEIAVEEDNTMVSYNARVVLKNPDDPDNYLNVRNEPSTKGRVIGKLGHGAPVVVQAAPANGWLYVSYGGSGMGYVSGDYIEEVEVLDVPEVEETPAEDNMMRFTSLIRNDGTVIALEGNWRVAED